MSFKPYKEKIKKKKIGICSRIRIHHPGSGSADPDPHQHDMDPKHCILDCSFELRLWFEEEKSHISHYKTWRKLPDHNV